MKKVYLVVVNCSEDSICTSVYADRQNAITEKERLVAKFKNEVIDWDADYYEVEGDETCFVWYEEGMFKDNHYCVYVIENEVKYEIVDGVK